MSSPNKSEFAELMFRYVGNSDVPVIFELRPGNPALLWVGRRGDEEILAPDGVTIMRWAVELSEKR